MGQCVVVTELNIVVQLGILFTGLKEMNDEMRLIKLAEMQITPKSEEIPGVTAERRKSRQVDTHAIPLQLIRHRLATRTSSTQSCGFYIPIPHKCRRQHGQ